MVRSGVFVWWGLAGVTPRGPENIALRSPLRIFASRSPLQTYIEI